MKCPRCGYEWESKIPKPKECPRCKGRLDYQYAGAPRIKMEKKEVRKEMTSKLPWVAAATIIVIVVGLGAWTLLGQAPAGTATITGIAGTGTVFAASIPLDTASGIENVYIIQHGNYNENDNLCGNENILGVITATLGSVNIAYETSFDIVVAVKSGSDNMAYVTIDNMKVGLAITGSFTQTDENAPGTYSHMAPVPYENSNYGTTSGWLRINAVWDNNNNGYKLPANGTLTLENINLWGWK